MNAKLKVFLALALCLTFLPSLAAAGVTDKAEVLDGHVVLTPVGKNNVVVLVDHLPFGGDGIADQAFIYRSAVALPADLGDLSGSGIVIVRPESIVVTLAGKSAISLSVRSGEPGRDRGRPGTLSKAATFTRIDSGFELRRLYGREGFDLVRASFNQLRPRQNSDSILKACVSGGVGATSCSLSGNLGPAGAGCSVSCASGYYACCNLNGCGCIDNDLQEDQQTSTN